MTYYLIWRKDSLQENLEAFSKLNSLTQLELPTELKLWALKFQLGYPNNMGTAKWSEPIICKQKSSEYYNCVAMPISDTIYNNITPEIIGELVRLGIPIPDVGIQEKIKELPTEWY